MYRPQLLEPKETYTYPKPFIFQTKSRTKETHKKRYLQPNPVSTLLSHDNLVKTGALTIYLSNKSMSKEMQKKCMDPNPVKPKA